MVHHQEVVFPGHVERLQDQRPLHPLHLRAEPVLDGGGQLVLEAFRLHADHLLRRQSGVAGRSAANRRKRLQPAVVEGLAQRLGRRRLAVEDLRQPRLDLGLALAAVSL